MMSAPWTTCGFSPAWTPRTFPVFKVQDLADNGRGAEVHGNAETFAGNEIENGAVGQDGRFPLADFQRHVFEYPRPAGETPAFREFTRAQDRRFLGASAASEPPRTRTRQLRHRPLPPQGNSTP